MTVEAPDSKQQPPNRLTIARHLRKHHGYEHFYSVSASPGTLMEEHRRIHEDMTHLHLDHTHNGDV